MTGKKNYSDAMIKQDEGEQTGRVTKQHVQLLHQRDISLSQRGSHMSMVLKCSGQFLKTYLKLSPGWMGHCEI